MDAWIHTCHSGLRPFFFCTSLTFRLPGNIFLSKSILNIGNTLESSLLRFLLGLLFLRMFSANRLHFSMRTTWLGRIRSARVLALVS